MTYKVKFSVLIAKGSRISEERDLQYTYGITDEQWDAMSEEDKQTFLNAEYQEFLNNHTDGGAHVE